MTYTARVLVIASVTAASDDLLDALRARAERGPIHLTLLMPATRPGPGGRRDVAPELDGALARWREAGLEAEGTVGDADPIEALHELWSPGSFDEVIVSTLPGSESRWLQFDFPHRVARMTDAPVTHVISRPPGFGEVQGGPPPAREESPLGRLSVLSWGGRRK